jgi:hypothetical protein
MKRFSALLFVALAVVAAHGQTASDKYQHIKSTWTAPNSTYPNCTSTVASSCLTGYALTFIAPAGVNPTTAIPPCVPGVTTNCVGPVSTYTWGPGGYLYAGTWNVSLTAVFLDSTGAQVQASPVVTTVVVPLPFVASPASSLVSAPAL